MVSLLQRLHKLGARKMVLFELGPIGCIPSIASRAQGGAKCDENVNKMVTLFNGELISMVQTLGSNLKGGSKFVVGHSNWLAYDAIMHPSNYGLKETSNPCCVTWFNRTLTCIPQLPPCSNHNDHFFWDAYHLTEASGKVVALNCINGSSVCLPMNIEQLVKV
ncbi:hypothetical protein Droror1_Dr00024360 [Drosera rotundifolia]